MRIKNINVKVRCKRKQEVTVNMSFPLDDARLVKMGSRLPPGPAKIFLKSLTVRKFGCFDVMQKEREVKTHARCPKVSVQKRSRLCANVQLHWDILPHLGEASALQNSNSDSLFSVFKLLSGLTSDIFISSISARVGALSRTRGRDGGRGPDSDMDKSMHEVDLTLQGQFWARQGREPNAEGREIKTPTGNKWVRSTEIPEQRSSM